MLGSSRLFIPGLFVLTFGVTLQAGATGAVKAIKMSVKLTAGRSTPTNAGPAEVPSRNESAEGAWDSRPEPAD